VTVVVPTRNRRELLARCVEAVARQAYAPLELIVVDDFSDDDTPAYLEDFAGRHPQLAFTGLRNEPQAGANPSRNRAIRAARGTFIAFLDDDCAPHDDWLQRLMAGFVSDDVAAVTGRVDNVEPRNLYELAFKGTQRVAGRVHATRLVGCNMCVRRSLLLEHMLDEDRAAPSADMSVSGRGDEEGLYLLLRAAGYEVRVVHDAVVSHDHHHTRRSYFRQAFKGGGAAARLGYKYGLPLRVDLTSLLAAWLLLPVAVFLGGPWVLLSAIPGGLFLVAITYNELFRKAKRLHELLMTLPILLVYYHLRLAGYLWQSFRLYTGMDRIERLRLTRRPRPASPDPQGD
jgi:glycosyltransferase involved in cell wall biosynthesis